MHKLLSDDNVVEDTSAANKSTLLQIDQTRKNRFHPAHH